MIDTRDLDARIIEHRLRAERANRSGWMRAVTAASVPRWSFRGRVSSIANVGQISSLAIGFRLRKVQTALHLKRLPS
ncbi:MAG: hypothetical protein H0U40_03645 [Chloroflexia bacterium]|nr:hypothetical protein [Chloroflexia bacterium]